jgi:hypothetical protein
MQPCLPLPKPRRKFRRVAVESRFFALLFQGVDAWSIHAGRSTTRGHRGRSGQSRLPCGVARRITAGIIPAGSNKSKVELKQHINKTFTRTRGQLDDSGAQMSVGRLVKRGGSECEIA